MATEFIRGLYNVSSRVSPGQEYVATIGNFDGVHLGHQVLLEKVKEKAKVLGVSSLVITFEPQPLEFFSPEKTVPRLTRWREKFNALAQYGIDKVLVLRFTSQLAELSADAFITQILCDKLAVKHIIVGDDFHFGHHREGDFQYLKAAGEKYGFTAEQVSGVMFENKRISSTWVRQVLQNGDLILAQHLLGRAYTMEGRIVHGNKLGRDLGFPTANIHLHRVATAIHGIYVVKMRGIADDALPGVANVGTRPAIGGTRALLEVHLLDFNQDIYGRAVCVEFCKKLRDEEHYANLELLAEQIKKDAENAREYFRSNKKS